MEENLKQLSVNPEISDIIKIAIYGPESTGKTTLASQLAAHFDTVWTPEFAREYLQKRFDDAGVICAPEDIIPIAEGQTQSENDQLVKAKQYLFCDTCLMQTRVYSEIYYNAINPLLEKASRKHKYDLFFLTDIDVPWEADDLRDRPDDREAMFDMFRKALEENEKPFVVVSGTADERLEKAISVLHNLERAKRLGFSSHDFVQIYQHGMSLETIEIELNHFRTGIPKAILDRPAVVDDGIVRLSDDELKGYAELFDHRKQGLKLEKFVPASGAASRMFKFLNEFLNDFDAENESINAYINRRKASGMSIFLAGIEKFPFYDSINLKLASSHPDFHDWDQDKRHYHFIEMMLDPDYLDFCSKPKGVLPFHNYGGYVATAAEEHLNETVSYANGLGNATRLHFTVTENHQRLFENIIAEVKDKIEKRSGNSIQTEFSYQDTATDTIAVDLENQPFRDSNDKLVFRPAGHGALLQNLNRIDADIVFIKNIDNVIQDHILEIAFYKKALAGLLTELQQQIFNCLREVESSDISEKSIEAITNFIRYSLNTEIIEDFSKYTIEHKIQHIAELLNRPIRVCGMVKNEGEPGGGPFWVRDIKGNLSLQIVESSQVDLQNMQQAVILARSTHFNPVDLVCGIRNYKGDKFNLARYVDANSGFIVEKNKGGRPLKAYELPGLWNGAMAKWITVFVEVPLITFNPVKTVNDLLKPSHQPS
jgi:nicotinamide riboside kinase